ncbi:gamma-interferon-inducible lysosomal thiol reductase isoform X1 [Drosophila miranda]|uniref:Gamma-interferon-inducible lysosomal thiol reductase-like isoform X1 n=1 Tax=Drosophila pseudoobscura pseudoobscura TaxID=46245 RepID=A0A6I8VBL4_DROPS|nr:gamma-interferon-inducible lysosomal thiol reductase isoform X1 [Drosophila pseudoobscura]XP_017139764.1 gamma-interferon-inducible lysosomal thiol reductase isoform X1 [Drosophila miranda]
MGGVRVNIILTVILIFFIWQGIRYHQSLLRKLCEQSLFQLKQLHITLLYESLCPDSRNFMHQLGPVHEELQQYMDIQLVPFGKSRSEQGGAIFHCQHGPAECEGNRVQSCVISSTANQSAQVKFVVCQMFALDSSRADQCASEAGLLTDVDHCADSETGTKLQLQAELVTKSYQPSFIPTIVYNGVFNQQLQDHSLRDFRGTVCHLLRQQNLLPSGSPVCQ